MKYEHGCNKIYFIFSPFKEHKQDVQENNRKYYNGNEDTKNDNTQQNGSQNGSSNPSYSSYNGYGGKGN